ncbi:MAG: SUMF1/EgtB/PvdO family nonheme iron enzyme [Candidatus Cloacimonetes bacterium]|nr:SUMF1/EgtB/PvdO family nonheme iron enzyme [Candidatus Cloacimonadota bacterium]
MRVKLKSYIFIGIIGFILASFGCFDSGGTSPDNSAPDSPVNPLPQDNSTSVAVDTILSWECNDPDLDPITYDVYFGTETNPQLVNEDQSETTYDPGILNEATTYYWQIKATDDHENSTTGDIWQFTTEAGGGIFSWCDVPAGEYTQGEGDTIKTIDYDYQIMKYEITNQQYVDFMEEAAANKQIIIDSNSVQGYYEGDQYYGAGNYEFLAIGEMDCPIDWAGAEFIIYPGYENHPVVEVSWFGAWAFAEHYGLRLPTKEEWEKAARGNTGWDYPFGNSIYGSRANYDDSGDPFEQGVWGEKTPFTTPVGMYNGQTILGYQTIDSPSFFGVYDMAGNVSEWTESWNKFDGRVFKDGDWGCVGANLESWRISGDYPTATGSYLGFRCVKD